MTNQTETTSTSTKATKFTIKPDPRGAWSHGHLVYRDGELIAAFHWNRNREVVSTWNRFTGGYERVTHILTAGELTTVDGRKLSLDNYCWMADIRRDIAFLVDSAE